MLDTFFVFIPFIFSLQNSEVPLYHLDLFLDSNDNKPPTE